MDDLAESKRFRYDFTRSDQRPLPAGLWKGSCAVSRQDKLSPPLIDGALKDPASAEYCLEVDLRLKLDEIAEMEADLLRRRARRQPSKRELTQLACKIYDARRARDKLLEKGFFGEPAWDMLLALYCLPARGEMLRSTALAYASNLSCTTGLRWQNILTEKGWIERGPKELPSRKQFFRLTAQGRFKLERSHSRLLCTNPSPSFSRPSWWIGSLQF
jgi:DNA-binding MarR family transcriptional regulator